MADELVSLLKSIGSSLTIQCSDGSVEESQLLVQLLLYHQYDNLVLRILDDQVVILPETSLSQYSQTSRSLALAIRDALFPDNEPNQKNADEQIDYGDDNDVKDSKAEEKEIFRKITETEKVKSDR